MKKKTRSEISRHAATVRWARVSKKDRSVILRKIAKKGAEARWTKWRKSREISLSTGTA